MYEATSYVRRQTTFTFVSPREQFFKINWREHRTDVHGGLIYLLPVNREFRKDEKTVGRVFIIMFVVDLAILC